MDMHTTPKTQLRRRLAAQRLELSDAERAAMSANLCRHLADWLGAQGTRQTFLFHPVRGEPDLTPLATLLPRMAFGLPVIAPGGGMSFRAWQPGDTLAPNRYGIPEPLPTAAALIPDAQTVVLTPCLALDRGGVRLGYGGGYYDRYLRRQHPDVVAVGVLFDAFVVDRLPTEPHDVRLSLFATDAGVRAVAH